MNQELIHHLAKYVTDKRFELFQNVIKKRTRYLTVVLEDIFQSQNASAVLRTCDCFGIQDVHIVENTNEFQVNPNVALGATKWLSLNHYNEGENNTIDAISRLKAEGYRIIATTPHTNDVNLDELDLTEGKIALVFGTELNGISDDVKQNADGFMKIPMKGFTESFNISVSAAIVLHHLTYKLEKLGIACNLSDSESDELLFEWLRKSIKGSGLIIKEFLKTSEL
jgi:tRNA (guanosine-2'-O-)-methyltransferase